MIEILKWQVGLITHFIKSLMGCISFANIRDSHNATTKTITQCISARTDVFVQDRDYFAGHLPCLVRKYLPGYLHSTLTATPPFDLEWLP